MSRDKKNEKPQKRTCQTCNGIGEYPVEHPSDPNKTVWTQCPWCKGTGKR